MKTVRLGEDHVSQLALGCMIMGTATPEPEAVTMLDRYAEAGGTFLDTADCYCWWGNAGSHGGRERRTTGPVVRPDRPARRRLPGTKGSATLSDLDGVWTDGQPDWDLARRRFVGAGADTLRRSVDASLSRSYLRLKSGHDRAAIVDNEQLDYLREHDDLTLVAYSPILKGIYDDPAKRTGHWAMGPYAGADTEARMAVLETVAAEVGAPPNQVVLAWLLRQVTPTMIPLVGPRTLAQYDAAASSLDITLTDHQADRLDAP